MKKYRWGLAALIMLFFVSCSRVNKEQENLPNYINFKDLPANYTLSDAKTDECVVFEDLSLTSGEAVWNKFLKMTQNGQGATIRFAEYYTEGEVSNLFLIDLSYDGSTYSVADKDEANKQYKYLNHYTDLARTNTDNLTFDYYILVNEKDVTFDELEKSLFSSNSKDFIEQYRIYVNKKS